MSTLEVNKITPVGVGTSVTLGDSGDTFTIPSGVTLTNNGTANFGKIGQVLQGQNNTQISTSLSSNDQDIVTMSITPTTTSSKILIIGAVMGIQGNSGSANTRLDLKVYRNSTLIMTSGANRWNFTTDYDRDGGFAINWLDSPSSTSSINYRLTSSWLDTGGSTVYINKDGNSGYSTITLMEVLA